MAWSLFCFRRLCRYGLAHAESVVWIALGLASVFEPSIQAAMILVPFCSDFSVFADMIGEYELWQTLSS